MPSPKQSKPAPALCCVRIGPTQVLMPADAGLKVVGLLRGALEAYSRFDNMERTYEIHEEVDLEYLAVKASQVRQPKPKPDSIHAPRAIGHEPLKLPHV